MTPHPVNNSLDLARACVKATLETKAENVRLYDLQDTSSITNYAIICTGLSIPHLRSILQEIEQKVKEETGISPVYLENKPHTLWSVMDYIDVMVHIMGEDAREFYALDALWKDSPQIDISDLAPGNN